MNPEEKVISVFKAGNPTQIVIASNIERIVDLEKEMIENSNDLSEILETQIKCYKELNDITERFNKVESLTLLTNELLMKEIELRKKRSNESKN